MDNLITSCATCNLGKSANLLTSIPLSLKEKSELVKRVLQTLIDISGRKTTKGLAVIKMTDLMKKLQNKYDFLKHVKISSKDFSGGGLAINVSNDVDNVHPSLVGKAIEAIIRVVYNDLNEEAGLYFISELKQIAGDKITLGIIERNVDLEQVQMEQHYAHRRNMKDDGRPLRLDEGRERQREWQIGAEQGDASLLFVCLCCPK